MSTAHDIARHLAASGIGTLSEGGPWTLRVGREVATPDNSITVYDTGGEVPDTDDLDLQPSIQVRVRSFNYLEGLAKTEAVRDLLITAETVVVDGTVYYGLEAISDVAHIGRDDRDRDLFTVNFITRKELG